MALIEQNYNLDLVPSGKPMVVNVSQYDKDSRRLVFNLFNGGVAYAPETGTAAYIMGSKPDQTGFIYGMTVEGTKASVDIYQQMTAVAGNIPCEIRLIDGNSNVLGTANFTLSVERAAMDDDTVISESDIPYFEDLATQAAASAASAAASAAIFPKGGTEGQVLTKTDTGTAWSDPPGGDVQSVNNVTPDTNGNVTLTAANVPITASGISATDTQAAVTETYGKTVTRYYASTLGSASAISDSTIYSGGYKLTVSNSTITANCTAVVFFPNGDYSGNVTWFTDAGKVDLYFDQNPNSKAIRVEWKTLTYSSATIS